MTQTQRLDVRELINRNPLSRFQKLIIFLGFCVIALDGFDIAIMGFIAPTLKLEWGVSNHQLGLVISAALIGLALGAIFSGPLADWLGRKKIIINSVFFFGFWTIATAFSHNVEQMMFFRFMTGLGLGAAMPNIGTLRCSSVTALSAVAAWVWPPSISSRSGSGENFASPSA